MKRISCYEQIAEIIYQEIRNGKFKDGERLYSRNEIVKKFHVSPVTATRVQNVLAKAGIIRKVRGGGIYYTLPRRYSKLERKLDQRKNRALKKIIYLNTVFAGQPKSPYLTDFIQAVRQTAADAGIEYCEQTINSSEISEDLHPYFDVEENAGYLVVNLGSISSFYGASVLLNTSIRSVYVDGIMTGSDSILADSFDGMRQLVDELIRQGCKRFIYAENFALDAAGIGIAERYRGALFHTRSHGIKLELVSSGSYDDLLAVVRKNDSPAAVMFPQDTPAGIFWRMLKKEKIRHVTVSGFDHFSHLANAPDILTAEPVFAVWARAAVRLLQDIPQPLYRVCFMPVRLHIPEKLKKRRHEMVPVISR